MAGTWFLNSAQLQHGGRFSIQHGQTKHSLVIHQTHVSEDKAEVTFIANGVRDSALLQVTRRWKVPVSTFNTKKYLGINVFFLIYLQHQ